jgi:acyl dehydratase
MTAPAVPPGYRTLAPARRPSLPGSYLRAALRPVRSGDGLPAVVLRVDGVRVRPDHLARYAALVGAPAGPALPPLYPSVVAFPVQFRLVAGPGFPFPAAGTVQLTNDVHQLRPVRPDLPLDVAVHAADLRPHRLGRTADLVTVVGQDGDVVWWQVATMLRRGPGAAPDAARTDPAPAAAGEWEPVGSWRLAADLGRSYAAVTGDCNPIHLAALTARPFGFRRPVVHGMWTAARLLHAVGEPLPPDGRLRFRVAFRRPVELPSTVDAALARLPGGGVLAEVRRRDPAGTACLTAELTRG